MSDYSTQVLLRAASALANQKSGRADFTPPTELAKNIFHRVTALGHRPSDIAKELGVTKGRISQHLRRVRTWLAGSPENLAVQREANNNTERRRLERHLNSSRHDVIYTLAIREAARQLALPTETTTRTESKPCCETDIPPSPFNPEPQATASVPSCNSNPETCISTDSALRTPHSALELTKVVTTTRPLRPTGQFLRIAQRSAIELQKLDDLKPLPEPPPAIPSQESIDSALQALIFHRRRQAEDEGRVPKSDNIDQLVINFLSALLGLDQGSGGGFLHLDDATRHLLHKFLICPIHVPPHDPAPQQLLNDLLADNPDQSACPDSALRTPHSPLASPLNTPKPPSTPATPSAPHAEFTAINPTPSAPIASRSQHPLSPHPLSPSRPARNSPPSTPQPLNPASITLLSHSPSPPTPAFTFDLIYSTGAPHQRLDHDY